MILPSFCLLTRSAHTNEDLEQRYSYPEKVTGMVNPIRTNGAILADAGAANQVSGNGWQKITVYG